MTTKKITALFALVLLSPSMVFANHEGYGREDRIGSYAYARVIRVEPIVREFQVEEPQNECWNEEIRSYEERRKRSVGGSAAVGGAIGGLIGSRFGRGNQRIASAAFGTVLGAVIGGASAQESNRRRGGYEDVRTIQRCRVVRRIRTEKRIEGYWVTYEYRGDVYETRLPYRPEHKIRVRVTVEPVAP